MTVIGNNSANNSNPLANISVTGAKGTDGSTGVTSFLDIISMLSSSAQALDSSSNANLLVTQMEPEAEPSTLALLQKFLDQEQISVPLLSEISSEDISIRFMIRPVLLFESGCVHVYLQKRFQHFIRFMIRPVPVISPIL